MDKGFENLRTLYSREKFLVVSNIAILTVTFFVLGFFLSTIVGMNTAVKSLEEQAQITLFFKDDFPESEILNLQRRLSEDPRINSVEFISKEKAYEIFTDINKDEPVLLEAISKDILPASLEIHASKLADLTDIANELNTLDGVEELKFFRDIIDRFRYWSNIVYVVGVVLVGIFVSLSFAIIMTTLRITINSKGDEIEIMKLVGASDTYVKKPLIFQGTFFSVIASVLASILLILVFSSLKFFGLFSLSNSLSLGFGIKITFMFYVILLTVVLILFGFLLGYIGSSMSVKKYLKY